MYRNPYTHIVSVPNLLGLHKIGMITISLLEIARRGEENSWENLIRYMNFCFPLKKILLNYYVITFLDFPFY